MKVATWLKGNICAHTHMHMHTRPLIAKTQQNLAPTKMALTKIEGTITSLKLKYISFRLPVVCSVVFHADVLLEVLDSR
jgi:hypothetical protein